MAGKVKELLEDVARKSDANHSSVYCVGDSLTIADIMVSCIVGWMCTCSPGGDVTIEAVGWFGADNFPNFPKTMVVYSE